MVSGPAACYQGPAAWSRDPQPTAATRGPAAFLPLQRFYFYHYTLDCRRLEGRGHILPLMPLIPNAGLSKELVLRRNLELLINFWVPSCVPKWAVSLQPQPPGLRFSVNGRYHSFGRHTLPSVQRSATLPSSTLFSSPWSRVRQEARG